MDKDSQPAFGRPAYGSPAAVYAIRQHGTHWREMISLALCGWVNTGHRVLVTGSPPLNSCNVFSAKFTN
jgi:hypothetical protein